jgi:hypothetical protein
MAFNPFIGRDQEWLEAELRLAQDDFAKGKTMTSVNAGDTGNTKQVQMSPQERIGFLLKALAILDPETYPPESVIRNTITRVAFT